MDKIDTLHRRHLGTILNVKWLKSMIGNMIIYESQLHVDIGGIFIKVTTVLKITRSLPLYSMAELLSITLDARAYFMGSDDGVI